MRDADVAGVRVPVGRRPGVVSRFMLALVASALVAGCSTAVVSGGPVAEPATVTLARAAQDESAVSVPVMPGWGYTELGASLPQYPSDRGMLANPGLREAGYTPTVIVSVDRLTEGGRAYAESLTGTLSQMSDSAEMEAAVVCGRPAFRIEFSGLWAGPGESWAGPGESQTQPGMGIVVVPEPGRYAYVAVLQTRDQGNPGYLAEQAALLAGFCLGG